jgi:hypothetical protein
MVCSFSKSIINGNPRAYTDSIKGWITASEVMQIYSSRICKGIKMEYNYDYQHSEAIRYTPES